MDTNRMIWTKAAAGHYTRDDGLSIQRHSRDTWMIHNAAGLIARRPSNHGGYTDFLAFGMNLDHAKTVAETVDANAPAFHSTHCPDDCPGHVKTWHGRLVTMDAS